MKRILLLLVLLASNTVSPLFAYERLQGPTQVTYWDRTKTYNGYTLFGAQGTTYLLDMEGRVAHTWPVGVNPRLLDNGNVLDATGGTIGSFPGLREVDWSGSTVWSYTEARTNYFPHHDFLRIYNSKLGTNTTLYIANKAVSSNQCVTAGCNPASGAYTNVTVDAIIEVNASGTVVWEWCFFDHGIQDYSASKTNFVGAGKNVSNYPGKINLNLPGRPLTNDWLHCTSLDFNTNLDQIVISAEGGEFYVIDHGNTFLPGNPAGSVALAASTNGDFLYRFGDPARYSAGSAPSITPNWTVSTTGNKQIGGVSQANWIPAGVPGTGHFLVVNNGQELFETTPQSYIFEINGYINSSTNDTGAYVNPPAAGYNTLSPSGHDTDKQKKSMSRQIVSMFYSMANQAFFSPVGGSAQRLPNGNMLVCSTAEGHLFEVTSAGEAVWEYINPVTTNGVAAYLRDTWPLSNPVYRATRIPVTHPALAGRTLTASATIVGGAPVYFSAPTIRDTARSPSSPLATDTVWVTATVTNCRAVASVKLTYLAGSATNTVSMLDDGAHQDGAAGDGRYGAQIPAFAANMLVSYSLSAQDDFDLTSSDPAAAPASLYSYTVQAASSNTPPTLDAQADRTVNPGYTLTVACTAHDSDTPAQTLAFSLVNPPANAAINAASGVLTFTPSYAQYGSTNRMTVVVTDSGTPALSATNTFNIIVLANTAPVLAAIPNRTLAAGETLVVTNRAADAEVPPQALSYVLATAPAAATLNPASGVLTWATSDADTGTTNTFMIVVFDNGTPSLIGVQSFSVVVTGAGNSTNYSYDVVLGRPTDHSITVSMLSSNALQVYIEYGTQSGLYASQTAPTNGVASQPIEVELTGLQADAPYYYRLRYKGLGASSYLAGTERTFHTQRAPGSTFTFSIQGDSHPERLNTMFNYDLYARTLRTAAADRPDFFMTIGDDFSVDQIPTNSINAALVTERYTLQRPYLGLIGNTAPIFLVNGNHEQAAAYLLDGTSNNIAVWAQNARNKYYPEPAPDSFYTGNTNTVPFIGLLRNYFSWTWGDALFVTIDPYWGSPTCVDDNYWTGVKRTNMWDVTHGNAQYQWLKQTLEQSSAKYKFVFAHHVMGTGRGGIEEAGDYEWGGKNANGSWGFSANRPSWALPLHQLMATNHVTIFFQGHDHIFARQQLDGVTYLTLPNPADPNYSLFNSDAYTNTLYKTNNTGYVRVTVASSNVEVDYVKTFLPADEGSGKTNGMVDYSFTLPSAPTTNQPPVITSVATAPALPVAGQPTWVTARVTDDAGVSSVTLNYSTGAGVVSTNTVFLETMATNAVKPWTGVGCDNSWTVAYAGGNPFEQRFGSNFGAGNTNGMEFKSGTTNLTDSMITAVRSIDARGDSATLSFALWAAGLSGNAGWALQFNSGTGFSTRVSELTGLSHAWQTYNYTLTPGDLVSNLTLRFQFRGGSDSNRIDLDQISLKVVAASGGWTSAAMFDDGLHGDGAAGDGVYGAQIPAQALGTTMSYYVTAADGYGLSATNPPAGAGGASSFVVGSDASAPPYDVLLGRPTDHSIAVSVLSTNALQAYIEYGTQSGVYTGQTATSPLTNGMPAIVTISLLQANQQYYYRMRYSTTGIAPFSAGAERTFVTQRARGSTFTFDIEADPHYSDSPGTVPSVWQQTLTNVVADHPDFLIDLGDTFMGEKYAATNAYTLTQPGILEACAAVRSQFFSITGPSVSLFLVNGNHDPELGWWLSSGSPHDNPPVWGASARERYYPCPFADGFYSGATNTDSYQQAPRDAYYAFEWGNALFVMLDPFWYSNQGVSKSKDPWAWTLGTIQYGWLKSTLENSTAKFKFVFAHHLVGGSFDTEARGGLEFAKYFEWGGYNTNGTWGFTANRPGWPMPIQNLLLTNGVNAFFHGHDHLYVKQDHYARGVTNGIPDMVYQEVPQPSHFPYDATAYATNSDYNYQSGVLYGGSGHLRVTVSSTNATVEYVRSYRQTDVGLGKTNRMVATAYAMTPPLTVTGTALSTPSPTVTNAVWVTATANASAGISQLSLIYNAGSGPATVAMVDDGRQHDGAAGDGIYGAQIPAFPAGTTVSYYILIRDALGRQITDPAGAPTASYSYTVSGVSQPVTFTPQYVRIPGGSFVMGDHFEYVDLKHYTDEVPLHNVFISPLYMSTTLCTMNEYCAYLNAALTQGLIEVRTNIVYAVGGTNAYFYTYGASFCSFIQFANNSFTVLNNRDLRPVTSVRWFGAIAYCNWLSARDGFDPCYNLGTGDVDFSKNGYRLPTEAEWEYAAHGGLYTPYCMFPWGTNTNVNGTFANWQNSGDPFESASAYPCTTPVGFYNGSLRLKSDYNWPGSQTAYQTSDGSNPYGLYDMAGNVWEWCNDWYMNAYYTNCVINNIVTNPPGPATGDLFDGQMYRCLRGGTWWNGNATNDDDYGHARVSNRDPAYYLGGGPAGDPYSEFSQTGFRVMRPEKVTQTVGLFLNATNAFPGYTLMSPMQGNDTYLLNNAGQYVHKWTSQYNPGRADYLMENGHLIRECSVGMQAKLSSGGGEGGRHEEHDWEGNLVWAFDYNNTTSMTHHDFKVLPNGNLIMLVMEVKTTAEVLAAGFNPSQLDSSITTNGGLMLPDAVIEVQPTRPYGGTIVWEWHAMDHLIQDYDSGKSNYGVVSNHVELINANAPSGGHVQQFWNHMNSIDYNPQLDQIMLSCRNNSELWVIDHQTTTAQATGHTGGRYNRGGDLLYRWGNPIQYKRGTVSNQMLWQQHDCTWIPTNCPGAGHILIHDNGIGRNYTSIDEIVPPVDAYGNYTRASNAAFGPTNLFWTYKDSVPTNYYSSEISGAQREPNGNTLICAGIFGTLFEVTPAGQSVWRYVSPVVHDPLIQGSAIPMDTMKAGQFLNEVFKVHRYPTNFVGFAGKDLTPRGTVEIYSNAATDTVGLGLPDIWVRSHFGSLSAVTATSSHSGNGLTDIQEYNYSLDPTRWSSLANGIPDGWSIGYGFDPTLVATATSINRNGYTTLQSYQADLNPTNPASQLRFTGIDSAGADVVITWIGGVNAWQYLESSSNLVAGSWRAVYTNAPPTPVTNVIIHSGSTAPRLFYRINATR